jgi:hypothetical protein
VQKWQCNFLAKEFLRALPLVNKKWLGKTEQAR